MAYRVTKRVSKPNLTKSVTHTKIRKNDLRSQRMKQNHELNMSKVNNLDYQKEITKRMTGATAATAVATPTTTALANTNAFSTGGFQVGNSAEREEESDSSNSNIWG